MSPCQIAGSGLRRALVIDRVRAAGEDDGARAASLQLLVRRVERQQLGEDVQFAHAAGDELGELAAEVEHGDGLRAGADLFGGTIGRRRVQRGLEVDLHLGIVRGQDPVAGVGRLAVDRLAPFA